MKRCMCDACKEDRRRALTGETPVDSDDYIDQYPGCFWEWLIIPSDKAHLPYPELLEAAGWEKVWESNKEPAD